MRYEAIGTKVILKCAARSKKTIRRQKAERALKLVTPIELQRAEATTPESYGNISMDIELSVDLTITYFPSIYPLPMGKILMICCFVAVLHQIHKLEKGRQYRNVE